MPWQNDIGLCRAVDVFCRVHSRHEFAGGDAWLAAIIAFALLVAKF